MTTAKEIDEQIKGDYERFWQSQYDGNLPSDLMFRFRQAIMGLSPKLLPGSPHLIRELVSKKVEDLKFLEVGQIINAIYAMPLDRTYDNPEQALDQLMELQEIEVEFNKTVAKKEKQIEAKRKRLLDLIGAGKTAPFIGGNGLKN